jgi:8-oxo-dGTP diphosphatase
VVQGRNIRSVMGDRDMKREKFYAGGFLYNPKTHSVLLHLRDNKTPIHPNQWGFFGGLNEGNESPKECFKRELREELGIDLDEEKVRSLCDYLNIERGTWRYVFYVESEKEKSEMVLNEGADFDWIPLDKVFEYDVTEKTVRDLKTLMRLHQVEEAP